MTGKQARELLAALAASDRAGAFAGVQEGLAAVAAAAPGGRWEVSVRGGAAPAVRAAPRSESARRGARFRAAAFPEPVGSALKAFDALSPIREVRNGSGGSWSLVLAKPLPWPLFLRSDLSASFVARAPLWALVLRDARVTALDFDGEALWARCSG